MRAGAEPREVGLLAAGCWLPGLAGSDRAPAAVRWGVHTGLALCPARHLLPPPPPNHASQVTVQQYYQEQYPGCVLRYPNAPLVDVGPKGKPTYLPAELCV
jgi:hypothetical protein